jgi:iron complex transport system permease protein
VRAPGLRRALLEASLLFLAAAAVAVAVGSVRLSPEAVWNGDPTALAILSLRLPRVALAGLTGAALAAAGAALQALLKNPLADPFLLGTSGGAAAGATAAVIFGIAPLQSPLPAFLGAAGSTFAVALLARRDGRIDLNRLLLSGVTANAFFSAWILLAFSVSSGSSARSMLFWMMGSLAQASAAEAWTLLVYFGIGMIALMLLAPELNLFLAGEETAAALGASTERTKAAVFLAAALLAGAATSFVGIVGFVGLLAPHLSRFLWGNDQRVLLPSSALLGGALLVVADAFSRFAFSPAEIPIGAVTALVGVPFFIAALRRAA